MSKFSRKADEVVQKGALERGEFNPTGAPLKMYKYWERVTRAKIPQTENFCHFWRVVVLWAPLNFIGQQALGLFSKSVTWYVTAALYVLAFLALAVFAHPAFAAFVVVPYVLLGLIAASSAVNDGWPEKDPDDQGLRLVTWLTLPVSGTIYAVFAVAEAFDDFLHDHPRIANVLGWLLLSVFALGLAALAGGLLLLGFMNVSWELILWIVGAVVLIGVGIVVFGFLSDLIDKALEKSRAEKDALREKYINGEITREEYLGTKPKREPNKFDRFLKGVGEFLNLAWNVLRVNKWKICPIVNVPPEPVED